VAEIPEDGGLLVANHKQPPLQAIEGRTDPHIEGSFVFELAKPLVFKEFSNGSASHPILRASAESTSLGTKKGFDVGLEGREGFRVDLLCLFCCFALALCHFIASKNRNNKWFEALQE
jgi:hypothetical protein